MKQITPVVVMLLGILSQTTVAQNIATTRNAAIDVEPEPAKMSRVENRDIKRKRAYPMQPPTIPHKTDDYQVDLNVNKCMSCHSRRRSEDSQAPMISVTGTATLREPPIRRVWTPVNDSLLAITE